MRSWILAAALALAACGQNNADAPAAAAPDLAAPSSETEAASSYRGANQAAQTLGDLTVTLATHLPDAASADQGQGAAVERLTLAGANGFRVTADLSGAAEPSVTVQGSTVRALMELGVGAAQTLVYRVTHADGASLCGQTPATHLVLWQPEGAGDTELKILPLAGGAPGEANVRACARLDYGRA